MKLITILLLTIAGLFGCMQPTKDPAVINTNLMRVEAAKSTYLGATIVVSGLHKNGKINDSDYNNIVKPTENLIYGYLTLAEKAAENGDVVTELEQLKLFNDALRDFSTKYGE